MSKGKEEQEDSGWLARRFKRFRTGIQATQEEGYRVVSMGEAELAKGYLEDSKTDVVFLDLYLNGFDGWDVLQDIKGKERHLPVLILTAYDSYGADPRVSQADGYMVARGYSGLQELSARLQSLGWDIFELDDYTLQLIMAIFEPDLAYKPPHWFDRIFNPEGLPKLTDEKEHGSAPSDRTQ